MGNVYKGTKIRDMFPYDNKYICLDCFNTLDFYIHDNGYLFCNNCNYLNYEIMGNNNVIKIDDNNRELIELLYK